MRTETIELYQFDELSDSAKIRARDWFRESSQGDNFYAECVFEDAADIADLMGINLRQTLKQLRGGGHRYEPTIFFSGFSSQGDGACFEGTYRYKKGAPAAVKSHTGNDPELVRIAQALQDTQRKHFYRLTASVKHSGHYYHENCTRIEVEDRENPYQDLKGADDEIVESLRDFMRWIYKQLEQSYDDSMSNETVDENIRCNEYEFDEEGRRC